MENKILGKSIITREAAEERRQYFLSKKEYFEQLDKKRGNHKFVRTALLNMNNLSREFLIVPHLLEKFFLLYLNKYHPSQQNLQVALNIARVFSVLVKQYYTSATLFKIVSSFYVSPSVWEKWLIGRKAKENSIKILKELGLIVSYKFNRNKFAPVEKTRIVSAYQFNIEKLKWLENCIKAMSIIEKVDNEIISKKQQYTYDDIMKLVFIEE